MSKDDFTQRMALLTKVLEDSPEALWAILTALRGPDDKDAWRVKTLTTARIRFVLFGHVLGTRAEAFPAKLSSDTRAARDRTLAEASLHFRLHWRIAVDEIRWHFGYDLVTETQVGQSRHPEFKLYL